jgi:hypothetical protein
MVRFLYRSCTGQRWQRRRDSASTGSRRVGNRLARRLSEARNEAAQLLLLTQVAGAGIKVLTSPHDDRFIRLGLPPLEVVQVGVAEPTSHCCQVEANVVQLLVVKRSQEVAAKLFARRAADAIAPPYLAQRVHASIATTVDFRQSIDQVRVSSQFLFDGCHLCWRKRFFEIRFKI